MNPWTPLAGATLGWAAGSVLTRAVLVRGVSTWTLIPLRMLFALVSLGAVIAISKRFWTTDPRAWKRGLSLGTVAMAIPMIFMTLAFEDLPVSLGGLLLALIPLSTVASAHFVCPGERFRGASVPGLLVALVGMGFLVGIGGEDIDGVVNLWRGVAFSVTGVALAGFGSALTRRYAQEVDKDQLVLPQFVVGTAVLFLLIPPLFGMNLESVDMTNLGIIAVIGTIGTTLPFTAFIVAAAINPAWRLGLTGYAVPVLAVLLAIVFLGEQFTLTMAIGAVFIVGGVVMADRANRGVPETIVPI